MPAAAAVTIEGREFRAGDCVLVDHFSGRVVTGTIAALRDGYYYRIGVRMSGGHPVTLWCEPKEVHSIRENFA